MLNVKLKLISEAAYYSKRTSVIKTGAGQVGSIISQFLSYNSTSTKSITSSYCILDYTNS